MGHVRECRLRHQYQHLYEHLPAGVWKPAREVAELLVERARKARYLTIHRRTFDARHFEFRGGIPQLRSPVPRRTRAQDQRRTPRQP